MGHLILHVPGLGAVGSLGLLGERATVSPSLGGPSGHPLSEGVSPYLLFTGCQKVRLERVGDLLVAMQLATQSQDRQASGFWSRPLCRAGSPANSSQAGTWLLVGVRLTRSQWLSAAPGTLGAAKSQAPGYPGRQPPRITSPQCDSVGLSRHGQGLLGSEVPCGGPQWDMRASGHKAPWEASSLVSHISYFRMDLCHVSPH